MNVRWAVTWMALRTYFFVANVNLNAGEPNVNVNRFENDNEWNGDNRHRVVVPKLIVSPVLILVQEFFVLSPSSNHLAFYQFRLTG